MLLRHLHANPFDSRQHCFTPFGCNSTVPVGPGCADLGTSAAAIRVAAVLNAADGLSIAAVRLSSDLESVGATMVTDLGVTIPTPAAGELPVEATTEIDATLRISPPSSRLRARLTSTRPRNAPASAMRRSKAMQRSLVKAASLASARRSAPANVASKARSPAHRSAEARARGPARVPAPAGVRETARSATHRATASDRVTEPAPGPALRAAPEPAKARA